MDVLGAMSRIESVTFFPNAGFHVLLHKKILARLFFLGYFF